jgi:hypothetical protein
MSEPNRKQIRDELLKREVMKQPSNAMEYIDQYSGTIIESAIRQHPSPVIQKILREYAEEEEEIIRTKKTEEEALRKNMEAFPRELAKKLDEPHTVTSVTYSTKKASLMERGMAELQEACTGKRTEFMNPVWLPTSQHKATWTEEIYEAAQRVLNPYRYASKESRELIEQFLASFDSNRYTWNASEWYSSEGVIVGSLGNVTTEYNVNGWKIDENPAELQNVIKQLNSGKIPFRVDHGQGVRDLLGNVRKAELDSDGQISVETDSDDENVNRILKRHSGSLGLSLGLEADAYCGQCGTKTEAKLPCQECGSKLKILKNVKVKEVSLTSFPAWKTAVVKKFQQPDEEEEETEEDVLEED